MLETAWRALVAAGIDARLAAQYMGVCAAPYCVVYEGMSECGKSVAVRHIQIEALAPAAKPGLLCASAAEIQHTMRGLGYAYAGSGETQVLDDYKAVSLTMTFTALCAL